MPYHLLPRMCPKNLAGESSSSSAARAALTRFLLQKKFQDLQRADGDARPSMLRCAVSTVPPICKNSVSCTHPSRLRRSTNKQWDRGPISDRESTHLVSATVIEFAS
ncbi:hypothetical protein MPTK1_5g13450 [Marchantia polymorpha subsp. ruderalis]|uniref:Uncharacterized protein n=2 Tax=Marchantia polymorpha TaxID=3197 RepID=A0AAF6BHY5_MARPO|nr:hypothetical protein MARPO_0032s0038 [Marchantia polymorpha]BBN11619.1 hypothetical protein Mp_5g13450 [Marchantia polymorpha subsp. ruderalis]|eukprot:PTQ41833.1 hypothetical protein MARPO_0032s0038 [Marchantia polymorpha]